MDTYDVVIAGAGHAGVQTAVSLLQAGYEGRIGLMSAETCVPYERPPLCKEYLSGATDVGGIEFRPGTYWDDSPAELLLDHSVVAVDAAERVVTTAHGQEVGYSTLVWAAGGSARVLPVPGHDLAGVFSIRNIGDVDAIKSRLASMRNAVIVGGGYIGLETAAALRKQGIETTVVEVQDRLLARVTSPAISTFIEAAHREHGVDVLLRRGVVAILGSGGQVTGVRLTDGTHLPADLVIIGIGLAPIVEPIEAAGALVDDGIVVDKYCRTTLPHVYAIGDVARHPNQFAGGDVRLESVQNAVDQARVTAAGILGRPTAYESVPWFWSNQYDIKLKTAGLFAGHDHHVVRGEPAKKKFSVGYFRDGALIAIDSVNAPGDYLAARHLIERGVALSPTAFADHTHSLKDAATGATVT